MSRSRRRAQPPLIARLSPSGTQLAGAVERIRGVRALVWGDFILDEYWRCRSARVSREAPVLVLEYEGRALQAGGAANAALNMAAMGASVAVAGWVGTDAPGRELRALMAAAGVETGGLLERDDAPTIVKTRLVAGVAHTGRQQVVRVDRGAAFPHATRWRAALRAAVTEAARGARAVVLSDYGYDTVTPMLARTWLHAWRRRGAVVALDARFRLGAYRGVTLATPNEAEAAEAAGLSVRHDRDLAAVARRLRRRLGARHLIVTRGGDGLTLWSGGAGASLAAWGGAEAVDVTGAGDAVVAAATLALAARVSPLTAAALANVAGSVAVSRRGAVAVRAADLGRAIRRGGRS